MKVVYIAGRYRAEHPYQVEKNIHEAKEHAQTIWMHGHAAICPHLNAANFEGLNTPQHFVNGTLELMRRCDVVFIIPGWEGSEGTEGEIIEAKEREMPIFFDIFDCVEWLNAKENKDVMGNYTDRLRSSGVKCEWEKNKER